MSSNPETFELNCFKRFFVISQFIRKHNIDRFVYSDSDILCYVNYSAVAAFRKYDVGMCVPQNQDEYRWVANCGVSLWTAATLDSFLDYCTEIYSKRIELLEEKWNYHISNGVAGGICDMTLQYLWYAQADEYSKLNLAIASTELGGVVDYNVNSEINYLDNEYQRSKRYGIKAIEFHDGSPYFVKQDSERVKALSIHFLGGAKRWLCDYQRYMKPSAETLRQYRINNLKHSIKQLIKKLIRRS